MNLDQHHNQLRDLLHRKLDERHTERTHNTHPAKGEPSMTTGIRETDLLDGEKLAAEFAAKRAAKAYLLSLLAARGLDNDPALIAAINAYGYAHGRCAVAVCQRHQRHEEP